jgi:hypothetical protein
VRNALPAETDVLQGERDGDPKDARRRVDPLGAEAETNGGLKHREPDRVSVNDYPGNWDDARNEPDGRWKSLEVAGVSVDDRSNRIRLAVLVDDHWACPAKRKI